LCFTVVVINNVLNKMSYVHIHILINHNLYIKNYTIHTSSWGNCPIQTR